MREFIDRVFRKYLTPRERKILYLYYGLEEGSEAMTLERIGALMGVTRERIRQIRERAFEKLRESPDGQRVGRVLERGLRVHEGETGCTGCKGNPGESRRGFSLRFRTALCTLSHPPHPRLKAVTSSLATQLSDIVGAKHVLQRPAETFVYTADGLPGYRKQPTLAVIPGTRDEVIAVVRLLAKLGVSRWCRAAPAPGSPAARSPTASCCSASIA